MKRKGGLGGVSLLALCLAVGGMGWGAWGEGGAFAVYVLTREDGKTTPSLPEKALTSATGEIGLEGVRLPTTPLIGIEDVASYDKDTHEMALSPDSLERIEQLEPGEFGLPFVVCLGRTPMYAGSVYDTPLTGEHSGFLILKPEAHGEQKIAIQYCHPEQFVSGRTDPRSAPALLQSLEKAGKLTKHPLSDAISELVEVLKRCDETEELTPEALAATDALYALAGHENWRAGSAVVSQRAGPAAVRVGDRFFSCKEFDKAAFYYDLALMDSANLPRGSREKHAVGGTRHKLALIMHNRDFEMKPLGAFAEAQAIEDGKTKRERLEAIKRRYPRARIVDDIDMALIRMCFLDQDWPAVIDRCTKFLTGYPESPVRREAANRLAMAYRTLGDVARSADRDDEAEKFYREFVELDTVTGRQRVHVPYLEAAAFLEERGQLAVAERAYRHACESGGRAEAYDALRAFCERHDRWDSYVAYLNERAEVDEAAVGILRDVERTLGPARATATTTKQETGGN